MCILNLHLLSVHSCNLLTLSLALSLPLKQVWETGVFSPLESPRALTGSELPSFSRSPLPYITEVWLKSLCIAAMEQLYHSVFFYLDWRLAADPPPATRTIHLPGKPHLNGSFAEREASLH